jgi:hypothetical protein
MFFLKKLRYLMFCDTEKFSDTDFWFEQEWKHLIKTK